MRPLPAFEKYLHWLGENGNGIRILKLSYLLKNRNELEQCHGLILTGGGDVHPKFYHREDAVAAVEEVNEFRDEFEFDIIDDATRLALPILGICRGMQLFNVAMGGSLIPDIESAGFPSHRGTELQGRYHGVTVEPGTALHAIAGTQEGTVNTIHHQAVDRIGLGLRITARSVDGVPEAMEWEDPTRKQFLLLVQWHPERMEETGSPFSGSIRDRFVQVLVQSAKNQTKRSQDKQ